jgi:hypothetical protein
VLGERRARLNALDETDGERRLAQGERRAHELGQHRGVNGLVANAHDGVELEQELSCLPRAALYKQ